MYPTAMKIRFEIHSNYVGNLLRAPLGKDGSAPIPTRYSAFVTRKRFSKYFRSILIHLGVENRKIELEKI